MNEKLDSTVTRWLNISCKNGTEISLEANKLIEILFIARSVESIQHRGTVFDFCSKGTLDTYLIILNTKAMNQLSPKHPTKP